MTGGTVKFFNAAKGWGMITTEEGVDVFVHHSEIKKDGYRALDEGEKVEFELCSGPKGRYAESVRSIK